MWRHNPCLDNRKLHARDFSPLDLMTMAEEGSPRVEHRKRRSRGVHSQDRTLRMEAWNMVLLVVLYLMQGVPLGLTMGAMPFMLQARASYTQIGIFSVASYPYSFKLFWSPVVDSIYSLAFGRRKSWVVPIQLLSALLLLFSAKWAEARLGEANVAAVTGLFFVLVLLAATQDIAVDGWALTLLSRKHVGYASTCQTVGMNIGYFTSFTVFLALNDTDFCNRYLRALPEKNGLLLLSAYMRFWGWAYMVITLCVWFLKREDNFQALGDDGEELEELKEKVPLREAYSQLWAVVKLPAMRRFSLVLLAFRLGVLPAEQAAPLKLLEKGVSKEALAGLVLLEFPCELVSAVVAGRWAANSSPFKPWMLGYRLRLLMTVLVTTLVYYFPADAAHLTDNPGAFILLAACGLLTSFTSTLMFTALGSFFNRISDPDMGGSYLTLVNTIANMGVILPKIGMFWMMDQLSVRTCEGLAPNMPLPGCPSARQAALGANECTALGGSCVMKRDGFFPLAYGMAFVGLLMGFWFQAVLPHLEALPTESWRARSRKQR